VTAVPDSQINDQRSHYGMENAVLEDLNEMIVHGETGIATVSVENFNIKPADHKKSTLSSHQRVWNK
jgi:hypothetical protein